MMSVNMAPNPEDGFLKDYDAIDGAHTDCFCTDIECLVTLEDFITAFFSTPIFKLERLLLRIFVGAKTTEEDVAALASGEASSFATWETEKRNQTQISLAVHNSPIRTWLKVEPKPETSTTQLYFGSAVLPTLKDHSGRPKLGVFICALMGFHMLYSRILLWSAKRRLMR